MSLRDGRLGKGGGIVRRFDDEIPPRLDDESGMT